MSSRSLDSLSGDQLIIVLSVDIGHVVMPEAERCETLRILQENLQILQMEENVRGPGAMVGCCSLLTLLSETAAGSRLAPSQECSLTTDQQGALVLSLRSFRLL